jgi:hypothetical protein
MDGIPKTTHETFNNDIEFKGSANDAAPSEVTNGLYTHEGVMAGQNSEGRITKRIENITSKIPSATFLTFAMASVALAAGLRLMGRKDDSQFVGQWVPTILTLGLYNKLVKLQGSE